MDHFDSRVQWRGPAPAVVPDGAGGDREFQTRALAAMFGAGAVLGLLAVLVPHGSGVNVAAWAANSALGLPAAAILFVAGARVPTVVLHALLVVGAGMVSLGMVFGDGGNASVATSFFFVWVALYAFWFFSPRAALGHLLVDAVLFAAILLIVGVPAGPAIWLLVMGTASVVGIVVALMHRQLMHAATIDPLTGLPTRFVLDVVIAREIARAQRTSSPLCLAIIDVDGLKGVNDRDGHQAGDRVLAEAAHAWRGALRDSDMLVRFGGDEFVAVLPGCTPEVADRVLERARLATSISCSAGLAWWSEGDDAAEVLARADAELYEAKRSIAGGQAVPPASDAIPKRPASRWR